MSQRYMTHPIHGRMPIYSDAEAEYNKKNGWAEEKKEELPALTRPIIKTIEKQYEDKFGKKPHHRMSKETIIAALGK